MVDDHFVDLRDRGSGIEGGSRKKREIQKAFNKLRGINVTTRTTCRLEPRTMTNANSALGDRELNARSNVFPRSSEKRFGVARFAEL